MQDSNQGLWNRISNRLSLRMPLLQRFSKTGDEVKPWMSNYIVLPYVDVITFTWPDPS